MHPITTFRRRVYLNFWAIFLLLLGIAVAFLPFYKLGAVAIVVQVLAVLLIEKGAVNIFNTWEDKKRKYTVLVERNRKELRPDTFEEYMQAPCGRLLVKVVLEDLGERNRYAELKRLKKGFWSCKRENFRRQKVSIRINPKYQNRGNAD